MSTSTLIDSLASLSEGEGGGILANIVVTAKLDPSSGKLGSVAGVKDKLKAAIQDTHIPRINAFAVSDAQTDVWNEPGIHEHTHETASPRLLKSDDFASLVVRLAGMQRGRQGVKPYDYHRTLTKNYREEKFVGREWLFERIAHGLEDHEKDCGYIVLNAGPGFGKTAFVLEFIERHRDKGIGTTTLGAWHLLRKTQEMWWPAISMVEQLEWRLRDRLGCPLDKEEAKRKVNDENVAEVLQTALAAAAGKLGKGQRLLLIVDGIDETFGANALAGSEQLDLLRRMFPPRGLPQGVFVLVTSRPGSHLLGWLNEDADIIDVNHSPELQTINHDDLYAYLEGQLKAVAALPGYAVKDFRDLAKRMTEACEGGFFVAKWFVKAVKKNSKRFEGWLKGETLPSGIDETLMEDWRDKLVGLDETKRALLPVLAAAIAIWHEAGTKVTWDVIVDLFETANDSRLAVGKMSARRIEREGIVVCLEKLRDWFDGGAEEREPIYTFRHSRIPELILVRIIDAPTRREVHRLLAWRSAQWQTLKGESRQAALANAPWHYALAEYLDGTMTLLANPCNSYLATVYAELDTAVPALARNYATAIQLAAMEERGQHQNPKSPEPPPLMHLRDIWRVLSQYGESLRRPECPLVPTLYNHLAAAWDPQSKAHQNLVQAADTYPGMWLQRLNPAPLDRRLIAVARERDGHVCCVALSPDGKLLAIGFLDGSLHLLNGQTGEPLDEALTGHTNAVECLAWSPDSSRLASGSAEGLRLWGGHLGAPVSEPPIGDFEGLSSGVGSLAWSRDGTWLASGSLDGSVHMRDGQTGAPLGPPLAGHTLWVTCLAWSPDGERLASGSMDGSVCLWNRRTGLPLHKPLIVYRGRVSCLAWSPDGTRLASSGPFDRPASVHLWNGLTGAPVGKPLRGHILPVLCLAWSPDSEWLVSGGYDFHIYLWVGRTGAPVGEPLTGHGFPVRCLAWSPDGEWLASGSEDCSVRLWDGRTRAPVGEPLTGHFRSVFSLAWSPDSRQLTSVSSEGCLHFWAVPTRSPVRGVLTGHTKALPYWRNKRAHPLAYWMTCFAWSPDGMRVALGWGDGTLCLWNGQTDEPLRIPLKGYGYPVICLAWSPNGEWLASGSDECVRIHDGHTGAVVGDPLVGHSCEVQCLAWSPDGMLLASGSDDHSVRRWNSQTRAPVGDPLVGHSCEVRCLAWSTDGTLLASGSDECVRIHDGQTGEPVGEQPLTWNTKRVACIAWSPKGTRLASGWDDGALQLWDGRIGVPVSEPLIGHTERVTCLAWSPNGTRLASGAHDHCVRLWDGQTGAPVGEPLTEHMYSVFRLAWSPDDTWLTSSSADGRLRLWAATNAECVADVNVQMDILDLRIVGDICLAFGRHLERPRVVRYRLKRSLVAEP